MHFIATIAGAIEVITAIIATLLCGKAVCCRAAAAEDSSTENDDAEKGKVEEVEETEDTASQASSHIKVIHNDNYSVQ